MFVRMLSLQDRSRINPYMSPRSTDNAGSIYGTAKRCESNGLIKKYDAVSICAGMPSFVDISAYNQGRNRRHTPSFKI
jgi:hypothetical protein